MGEVSRFRRRTERWRWFWTDFGEALAGTFTSRLGLVFIGDAALFLTAVLGLVHFWSRAMTVQDYALLQAVCLACQAVALYPVARPGRGATPGDIREISDTHQGATVALVCGTWIFGYLPAAPILVHVTGDADSKPVIATMLTGTALMLACVAGLITAVALSSRAAERAAADSPGPPGVSGMPDTGDVGGGDFGD
ncbi:hypothetical protein SUDANB96_02468 [Streptomyces sp. enrichment culture]